jgi:hypothetical protein
MPDVRHLSVWHGPTEVLRDDSLPAPGGDGGRARGNGAGKMNPFEDIECALKRAVGGFEGKVGRCSYTCSLSSSSVWSSCRKAV